jgi:hypothetical protein
MLQICRSPANYEYVVLWIHMPHVYVCLCTNLLNCTEFQTNYTKITEHINGCVTVLVSTFVLISNYWIILRPQKNICMDQQPWHCLQAVVLSPPLYFFVFSTSCLAVLLKWMLVEIAVWILLLAVSALVRRLEGVQQGADSASLEHCPTPPSMAFLTMIL